MYGPHGCPFRPHPLVYQVSAFPPPEVSDFHIPMQTVTCEYSMANEAHFFRYFRVGSFSAAFDLRLKEVTVS